MIPDVNYENPEVILRVLTANRSNWRLLLRYSVFYQTSILSCLHRLLTSEWPVRGNMIHVGPTAVMEGTWRPLDRPCHPCKLTNVETVRLYFVLLS